MKQHRASTSPKTPPHSADLTSLSSFLDKSLVLGSPSGSGGNAQSGLLTTSRGDDDEVVIEFDLQNSPSPRKAPPTPRSSSTVRNLLTDDEANDLRIRFNMKVASIGDRDAAGGVTYLDKEDFFELVRDLKDEGRLVSLPPIRELSYLYMESDSDEGFDFENLSRLYIKIRDGVLPKNAGMAARMKKSFLKMSGGPYITPNYDDMPADERLETKYGISYIFQDPPGADAALALLKKYFTRSSLAFSTSRRKGDVSMTRSECLELLPKMLDGKERYDSYKCNGGYHELPWGPSVISLKKLTALFEKKNRRPDLVEGRISFGDFAELYVECHLGKVDMAFQTAPRPSALGDRLAHGDDEPPDATDQELVAAAAMALSKVEAATAHRKSKKKQQHQGNRNTNSNRNNTNTNTSMAVVQVTPPPAPASSSSAAPPCGGGKYEIPEVEI